MRNLVACEATGNLFYKVVRMKISSQINASGRYTVSMDDVPRVLYRYYVWVIKRRYKLVKMTKRVSTVDQVFQDFQRAGAKISIGWDNWSGLTVSSLDEASDELAMDIEKYCEIKFKAS